MESCPDAETPCPSTAKARDKEEQGAEEGGTDVRQGREEWVRRIEHQLELLTTVLPQASHLDERVKTLESKLGMEQQEVPTSGEREPHPASANYRY